MKNYTDKNFSSIISVFEGKIGDVTIDREDFFCSVDYIISIFNECGLSKIPNELISWVLGIISSSYSKQDDFSIGEFEAELTLTIKAACKESNDFSTLQLSDYFAHDDYYTEEFHKIDLTNCFS